MKLQSGINMYTHWIPFKGPILLGLFTGCKSVTCIKRLIDWLRGSSCYGKRSAKM